MSPGLVQKARWINQAVRERHDASVDKAFEIVSIGVSALPVDIPAERKI